MNERFYLERKENHSINKIKTNTTNTYFKKLFKNVIIKVKQYIYIVMYRFMGVRVLGILVNELRVVIINMSNIINDGDLKNEEKKSAETV